MPPAADEEDVPPVYSSANASPAHVIVSRAEAEAERALYLGHFREDVLRGFRFSKPPSKTVARKYPVAAVPLSSIRAACPCCVCVHLMSRAGLSPQRSVYCCLATTRPRG